MMATATRGGTAGVLEEGALMDFFIRPHYTLSRDWAKETWQVPEWVAIFPGRE
jgi:hypothetical protein